MDILPLAVYTVGMHWHEVIDGVDPLKLGK